MTDRELRLNGLRAERSPRLVLEEYGHCEVPAGCGGAVLRWRRASDTPVTFLTFCRGGTLALSIDGVPLESSLALVAPGPHVLGCRITDIAAGGGFVIIAALDARPRHVRRDHDRGGRRVFARSEPDGSWTCLRAAPADDSWASPAFYDPAWTPMEEEADIVWDEDDRDLWRYDSVAESGARPLVIPASTPELWLRLPLIFEAPGEQP